jgi:5-methyltetrahydrofolate--homocysteine methyltransferase
MKIIDKLVNGLLKNDVKIDNIFVEPLFQILSLNSSFGKEFLDAFEKIMEQYEGIHTAYGLSNIFYGLPVIKFLNQTLYVIRT